MSVGAAGAGFPIVGAALVVPGATSSGGQEALPALDPAVRFYDPATDPFLPPRQRRRMSRLTCMAIRATMEARGWTPDTAGDGGSGGGAKEGGGAPPTSPPRPPPAWPPLVFATANGEVNTNGTILESLLGPEGSLSPTLFHNSVHNTGPGYLTILTGWTAPTTTLSMGELSFEYAMVEVFARLGSGASEVQVTAGDEAIVVPPWADPPHCTHDFCGSLRLLAAPAEGTVPLGRLLAVHQGWCAGPDDAAAFGESLVARYGPAAALHADVGLLGRCAPASAPGGPGNSGGGLAEGDGGDGGVGGVGGAVTPVTNPCLGLYHVLRFLLGPWSATPRKVFLKAGRDGDVLALVVERGEP